MIVILILAKIAFEVSASMLVKKLPIAEAKIMKALEKLCREQEAIVKMKR